MKGKQERISGVILAGGAGKRFGGKAKHNVMVGGKTILSRMLDVMEDIFSEILIVTAKNNTDDFQGYKIIHDEFPGIGPLGGIHASLKHSTEDSVFVFAGDMPLINKKIILQQIELFSKDMPGILVPRYGDYTEPLHSIYNSSVLQIIENFIRNDTNHPVYELFKLADAKYFDLIDSDEIRNSFMNINTPGDVERAERILNRKTI